jgi:Short repeat of unknown function (DUF308)
MPGVTLAAFILLFAAYMLVDGIFAIAAGFQAAQRQERSWPLFLKGVVDILAGTIAFFRPAITLLVLVFVVAFWAIVSGILLIAAAFHPPWPARMAACARRHSLGDLWRAAADGADHRRGCPCAVVWRVRGRLRRRHADRRLQVAQPAPACRALGACRLGTPCQSA